MRRRLEDGREIQSETLSGRVVDCKWTVIVLYTWNVDVYGDVIVYQQEIKSYLHDFYTGNCKKAHIFSFVKRVFMQEKPIDYGLTDNP